MKVIADDKVKVTKKLKIRICCRKGRKLYGERRKYWLSTFFSFSNNVFNRPLFQVNPFPHDKILDQTKLIAFVDDKLNVTKMIISAFDRVENIVGRGEIACTSNFSFSHNDFKRLLSQTRQKVSLCGNGLKEHFPWV